MTPSRETPKESTSSTLGGVAIYCALNTMPKESLARVFSAKEKTKYEVNKATVVSGCDTARDWSSALLEIKTTESYQIEFQTWEEWVAEYVPWSLRTLESLFNNERSSLAAHIGEPVIRTKRKYDKKDKAKPHDEYTGNLPQDTDKKSSSPLKKQKVCDQEGHVIPEHLIEYYNLRPEFESLMKSLGDIKERLEILRKGSRIWKKVSTVAESHIEQAIGDIKYGYPHTVCTECQGWFEETKKGNCGPCNSTGLMSLEQFMKVDKEIQKLHRYNNEGNRISRLPN